MPTRVSFEVCRVVPMSSQRAWERLIDWGSHGEWIPATRVDVDPQDPDRFVAWSGIGRLALEDRMHSLEQHFDGTAGRCRVAKLGPVLIGEAEFSVTPGLTPGTAVVHWREDVTMKRLPRLLSPVAARVGAVLFAQAIGRLARHS